MHKFGLAPSESYVKCSCMCEAGKRMTWECYRSKAKATQLVLSPSSSSSSIISDRTWAKIKTDSAPKIVFLQGLIFRSTQIQSDIIALETGRVNCVSKDTTVIYQELCAKTVLFYHRTSPLWYSSFKVLFHLSIHFSKWGFLGYFPRACIHWDQEIPRLCKVHGYLIHLACDRKQQVQSTQIHTQSRYTDKIYGLARHAHSYKGAVIPSLLLFAAERLDLRLEVGGPWFTGKYKLRWKHIGQQWFYVTKRKSY